MSDRVKKFLAGLDEETALEWCEEMLAAAWTGEKIVFPDGGEDEAENATHVHGCRSCGSEHE
jgi:hypothetical protein